MIYVLMTPRPGAVSVQRCSPSLCPAVPSAGYIPRLCTGVEIAHVMEIHGNSPCVANTLIYNLNCEFTFTRTKWSVYHMLTRSHQILRGPVANPTYDFKDEAEALRKP